MKKIGFLIVPLYFSLVSFVFAAKKPAWINNPAGSCSKDEICATGSGASPNIAKTDARNNILKYFETNISSEFNSSLEANDDYSKSFSSEDNREVSEGILKGVEITENYDDGVLYYSFAVLDKKVAVKEIRSDIEKIDARMQLLLDENGVRYNKQLENLYLKRDNLNKKYLVLTGELMPDVVEYGDIFKAKKSSIDSSLVYYILPSNGYEQQVNDYLASLLSEYDIQTTNNKNEANRIIILTINKTDLHMNVKGFIKQMYILKIENSNRNGEVVSTLYKEFSEAGRSEDQIRELVNMKIKDYIAENIENLI